MDGVEVELQSFLTSAVVEVKTTPRPGYCTYLKQPPDPLNRSLFGAHGRSGRLQEKIKFLPKLGFETRIIHSVA